VFVRWDHSQAATDASADFVCSFLIVLRHETRKLAIWRDATPVRAFRRLSIAVRWRVQRLPG
jgi:hypothetical protein